MCCLGLYYIHTTFYLSIQFIIIIIIIININNNY